MKAVRDHVDMKLWIIDKEKTLMKLVLVKIGWLDYKRSIDTSHTSASLNSSMIWSLQQRK